MLYLGWNSWVFFMPTCGLQTFFLVVKVMSSFATDFDNTCSFGQYIQAANVPYYEQSEDGSFGIAGARSEQGAIGCCAYFQNRS